MATANSMQVMRKCMFYIALLILAICCRASADRRPLGVNRTELGSRLPSTQLEQLHRVADSMLQVYQTLADMRYLDHKGIILGPHAINRTLCEEYDIDDSIIYLWQNLPYIDTRYAESEGFIFGGRFSDFRNEMDILQSRDPMYVDPEPCPPECQPDEDGELNGPYMKSTMTPLDQLGNHECVIFYDAEKDHIWILDQEGGSTCDPALQGVDSGPKLDNTRASFVHEPSRPAVEVLQDLVLWYRELSQIPGSDVDCGDPWWDYGGYKILYLKHGWPDHFDGDAFEVDLVRFRSKSTAEFHFDEIARRIERQSTWIQQLERELTEDRSALLLTTNEDEAWATRFRLWRTQKRYDEEMSTFLDFQRDMHAKCPKKDCRDPQAVLLLELENIQGELDATARDDHGILYRRRHRAKALQRALTDVEAQAKSLYPIAYANYLSNLNQSNDWLPGHMVGLYHRVRTRGSKLAELQDWASAIPEHAVGAWEQAKIEIQIAEQLYGEAQWDLRRRETMRFEGWRFNKKRNDAGSCRGALPRGI